MRKANVHQHDLARLDSDGFDFGGASRLAVAVRVERDGAYVRARLDAQGRARLQIEKHLVDAAAVAAPANLGRQVRLIFAAQQVDVPRLRAVHGDVAEADRADQRAAVAALRMSSTAGLDETKACNASSSG